MKIFSLTFLITVTAIIFCQGCSKQNAENTGNNWETFTSEEGGFNVYFPGLPEEEIKDTKPFPAHLFIFKANETNSYIVIYSDVPKQPDPRGPDKVFEDARDAIMGRDAKPLQEISITNHGYAGREIEWEPKYKDGKYGEAFAVARFFVTKNHFYEVMVGVPTQDRFSTNIWYFLNSFKLLDTK